MSIITYDEYQYMLRDPDTSDEEIMEYSLVHRVKGPFDIRITPDPAKVMMTDVDRSLENAMGIANGIARLRRQIRFHRRSIFSNLPVLVSEGDSWFQFPMIVSEVIDQLDDDFLVWSVGAAGDTLSNMVYGKRDSGHREYMDALLDKKDEVKAFLFSAAGNDIIGEDEDGTPVLTKLLKDYTGQERGIRDHINQALLEEKLEFLRKGYSKVIADVRKVPEFRKLPILIHGYDYVFPYPWGSDDPRDPIHAANDEWLGKPLSEHGIPIRQTGREIIKTMLDDLYSMMEEIASSDPYVHVIDCRGAMPELSDWIDEIHGTSDGFAKVAALFKAKLDEVI